MGLKSVKPKKILINYADEKFRSAQKYCTKMAYKRGKFDEVWEYGPGDVEPWMITSEVLASTDDSRIGKYGLWRPYIVINSLQKMNDGDYLFYCDSGAYFNKSVDILIDLFESDKLYLMSFDIPTLEKQWSKRDIFLYLDADKKEFTDTPQRMSGMFLVKKCRNSMVFFEEYYRISLNMPQLFTDSDNELGMENYKEFICNRHNQSVFSILTKKYGIEAYRDPTEFGDYPEYYALKPEFDYTPTSNKDVDYKKVIISHRYPEINAYRKIKLKIRTCIPIKLYFDVSFFMANIRKKLRGNG